MAKLLWVVEDDEYIRADLSELLALEGYEVRPFRNGQEALNAAIGPGRLPDLVLLDLMMPVMNGYEFLDEVARTERLRSLAIIVVSADRQADSRLRKDQVRAFVSKPINVESLLRLIGEAVG